MTREEIVKIFKPEIKIFNSNKKLINLAFARYPLDFFILKSNLIINFCQSALQVEPYGFEFGLPEVDLNTNGRIKSPRTYYNIRRFQQKII